MTCFKAVHYFAESNTGEPCAVAPGQFELPEHAYSRAARYCAQGVRIHSGVWLLRWTRRYHARFLDDTFFEEEFVNQHQPRALLPAFRLFEPARFIVKRLLRELNQYVMSSDIA